MQRRIKSLHDFNKLLGGDDMSFCSKVDEKLMAIAKKLTEDEDLQWDLYQEMSVHIWQIKRQYPDESDAWYFNGCRYRAIDYLKRGKSIDSKKRANVKIEDLYTSLPNGNWEVKPIIDDKDYESEIIVSDLVDKIGAKLTKTQRKILDYLLQGFSQKEIGKLLAISQQAVSKHRLSIKQVAAQFLL